MKPVLYILFGWSLTVVVSWCLGKLLLRRLSILLFREEEDIFAFLAGSAGLSTVVFVLSAMHLAYKGVFLGLSLGVIGMASLSGVGRPHGESFPSLPAGWNRLFVGLWLVFGVIYFTYALAPESSPDGSTYHLGL